MSQEMHGEHPASSEPSMQVSSSTADDSASDARPSAATPRILSPEAHEQLMRAMEQKEMHVSRMARKAGHANAEDMWQRVIIAYHARLLNHGPVEHLDSYLNRCVTNELSKLRTSIDVLIGDQALDLTQADDPHVANVVYYNHDLIEAVRGIRKSGVLNKRELDVWVLGQILGEDNKAVAEWLDPPSTRARVATIKWRALHKLNRAWNAGEFKHLGFEPPRD